MPSFRKIVYALILLAAPLISSGQDYYFENYTTREGLVSDEVYSMHQDRQGYIWLFTNFGAQKYNGSTFRPALQNLPKGENFIYSVFENEKGRMWVANSMATIYEVRNDSAFLVKGLDSVSTILRKAVAEIFQLYVDDSLNMYMITKRFSYKLQKEKQRLRVIDLQLSYASASVAFRLLDKKGAMLPVSMKKGLQYYQGQDSMCMQVSTNGREKFYTIKSFPLFSPGRFKKANGVIYGNFEKKIIIVHPDHQPSTILSFKTRVQHYAIGANGHLWVGCLNDGLYEFDDRHRQVGHFLPNTTINHVLLDSQQGLWVSTPDRGIFHCVNLNVLYYPPSYLRETPLAFIKLLGNNLVIANTRGDVFLQDSVRLRSIHTCDGRDAPTDIIEIKNRYFISGLYRVEQVDKKARTRLKDLSLQNKPVSAYKLYNFTPDTLSCVMRRTINYFANSRFTRQLTFDYKLFDCVKRDKQVFLCADKGILLMKGGTAFTPAFLEAAANIPVRGATLDSCHRLWFYTQGYGLFILDRFNHISHLTLAKGLPSDIIKNVSFTEDQRVLLSTNKGLYVSDYSCEPSAFSWRCLYPEAVTNAISFHKKIYLHTRNRLAVMDRGQAGEPPVYHFNLAGVSIHSRLIDTAQLRALRHFENTLQFDLDLVSFTKEVHKLTYSLAGPLTDEGTTPLRQLKFGNLPPGNYTLTVFPQIKNGKLLRLLLPFSIRPAFHQTWQFRWLISLATLFLITLVIWLIFRVRKKRENERSEAFRLVLEYKLIALKAQINPHFMSNCLASIQNLILSNRVLQAASYISKFGLLVRHILNFSTSSLISLKQELDIALLYLELEQMRFQHKFTFKVEVSSDINTTTSFVPSLILNPVLENAVWHGISALAGKEQGELLIRVYRENGKIILAVSDNGPGIIKKEPGLNNARKPKGIALVEQRLRNINFLYRIDSAQLVYQSRTGAGDEPNGTTAVISLPDNLEPLQDE